MVEAEKVIDKLKATYDAAFKKDPWTIDDAMEDCYMEWKHVLGKLEKSAPTTPFHAKTKNAKIVNKTCKKNRHFSLSEVLFFCLIC